MLARLALDLDHDAIRLLSHQSDGWVVEAAVDLSAPDFTARIAGLRRRATDLGGDRSGVLLVLPRSEVLYTTFGTLADPADEIPALLESMTPYQASEITWDHVVQDGETVVAAVALQTLDEALDFAGSSGFHVIALTSEPPEGEFPRMPVFRPPGRGSEAAPLVLEPAAPPERRAVAFSENRGVDYGPKLPERLRAGSRGAAASALAAFSALPKPALFAGLAVAVGVLAFALRPEIDPDRFARGVADQSFTVLPAALEGGLATPAEGKIPALPAPSEAVTVLRDAPPIVIPVVLGTSPVEADTRADVDPASAFERVARALALYRETVLPGTTMPRPAIPTAPKLADLAAPGTDRVARAAAPSAFGPSPGEGTYVAPSIVADPPPQRQTAVLPEAGPVPDRPGQPIAITEPTLTATAPAATSPPAAEAALAVSVTAAEEARPAAAPGDTLSTATLPLPPNAAMALLAPQPEDRFEFGPDGFVVATPDGTLTPGGVLAVASAPPLVAPPRPREVNVEPTVEVAVASPDPALDAETEETRADTSEVAAQENPFPELAAVLSRPRPRDAEPAPPAVVVPETLIAEALVEPEEEEPVLVASLLPRPRPDRPAETATPTAAAATRAAPVEPRIPSRANVAREATIENALPLGNINLIGVYGTASDRRALVRLPTGRFVKLKVGDRLDGGQVAQIGPDRLLYRKGGRTLALDMPNS